jgi:hypothetical protein
LIQSFKRGKKRDTGRFPMRGLSLAKNRVVEGHTDEEGKIRGIQACRGPE